MKKIICMASVLVLLLVSYLIINNWIDSAAIDAAADGDMAKLVFLVRIKPSVVNEAKQRASDLPDLDRPPALFSILSVALQCKKKETALFLISEGANVNTPGVFELRLLHFAAEFGDIEVVKELLKHGANPNAEEICGDTPLNLAITCKHKDLALLLISEGVNVNASGTHYKTTLHKAVELGDTEIVKELLEHGADPNAKDMFGDTPLDLAIKAKNKPAAEIIRQYMKSGR